MKEAKPFVQGHVYAQRVECEEPFLMGWLPHPKKPRYKATFPLRKVTFIFIGQSFALLTNDFQCFFVTLQPKHCIYFNYP